MHYTRPGLKGHLNAKQPPPFQKKNEGKKLKTKKKVIVQIKDTKRR